MFVQDRDIFRKTGILLKILLKQAKTSGLLKKKEKKIGDYHLESVLYPAVACSQTQ